MLKRNKGNKKKNNSSMLKFKKKVVKVKMPKDVEKADFRPNEIALEKVQDVYREAAEKADNDDSDDEDGAGATKLILMPIDEEASDESEVDEEDVTLKKI